MICMRNLLRALALFVILTSVPVVTNAATAVELAAQAETLLQQIAALQAQLSAQTGAQTTGTSNTAPVTVSSANCPLIGRVLKLGSTGDDVSRLQRFLAADASIYPEAQITGYYGALTEAAVKRWQSKYNIVSSGDAESTGYGVTGPRTAAAISLQCSTVSGGGGMSNVTSPTVGGFIQVSPVSGNAPLTVQVIATINTVNSCDAATYVLEWGDGTIAQNIQVPAGKCTQLQYTYSHAYIYGGTYLVRLSAGQHSTTATITVSGAAGPGITTGVVVNTGIATVNVTSPLSGQTYAQGSRVPIAWGASNIPGNSRIILDLFTSAGAKVGNSLDNTANLSGTYDWTIPSTVAAGSYKIRASLVSSSQVATGESGVFTITGSGSGTGDGGGSSTFSYGPLGVTPLVSNNPLQVAASFNIPTSCTGYTLSWGDGTSSATQAHSTGCANTAVTRVFTHIYAGGGSYTITLRRGADLSQVDTASVVIQN